MKWLFVITALAAAQAQSPTFEVASIKPAPPPVPGQLMRMYAGGGPGTKDPGHWNAENMNLWSLVMNAFELRPHQMVGPDWMKTGGYNITAKVPEGATKEQVRQMLQNLLTERFGLKFHREQREMQGFELVVAKNGPKFKESAPDAAAPPPPGLSRPSIGADGFPTLPPGVSGTAIMNGRARSQWRGVSMENFANNLAGQTGKPVTDATGLTGKYDLSLYWAPDNMRMPPPPPGVEAAPGADAPGPTIYTAIQEQLGLKLESKKVTVSVLIIDEARKTPTEN